MLSKETISRYHARFNDVCCVIPDASEAIERVRYAKLIICLFDRKVPVTFTRFLFILCTNHFACMRELEWSLLQQISY